MIKEVATFIARADKILVSGIELVVVGGGNPEGEVTEVTPRPLTPMAG